MPITPFHMGPALVVKAAGGRHFSLMIFGFSQVVTDLEPLIGIVRGSAVLHGFSHTFLGAALLGAVSVVIGRPICEWLLGLLRVSPQRIPLPAACAGAFIGTYSHILLDGMMHLDMQPFAPFSDANPMLDAMSELDIYLLCVAAGMIGAFAIVWRWRAQFQPQAVTR